MDVSIGALRTAIRALLPPKASFILTMSAQDHEGDVQPVVCTLGIYPPGIYTETSAFFYNVPAERLLSDVERLLQGLAGCGS